MGRIHVLVAGIALLALIETGCTSTTECKGELCDPMPTPDCDDFGCESGSYCAASGDCLPGCNAASDCGGAACVNHDCQEAVGQGVDILFVVDDSARMEEEQAALAAAFPDFISALVSEHGGMPDLHIGVVSTNLGAGPFAIQTCQSTDNGAFQLGTAGCPGISGNYIYDVSDGAGGRATNYTGSLAEAFSCAAQLGTTGCGFEQPLESMRRALNGSNSSNAGFLREDAALAIVIVGDEDDCSVEDTQMFDPSQNSGDSELGWLSSFRCFEFGVVCDPDDPRTHGAKTGCEPREDSPYMYAVGGYLDFLTSLKAPSLISVAVLAGPVSPVEVGPLEPMPEQAALLDSCSGVHGPAAPAIRLGAVAAAFSDTGTTGSSCDGFAGPLGELARDIALLIE